MVLCTQLHQPACVSVSVHVRISGTSRRCCSCRTAVTTPPDNPEHPKPSGSDHTDMRIMYDSTVPGNIPETGANMIGCYNDGSFENVVAMIKRFPNMQLITIDVNGSDPACRVLDYEPGDVQSPATAIAWVKASQEKGNL